MIGTNNVKEFDRKASLFEIKTGGVLKKSYDFKWQGLDKGKKNNLTNECSDFDAKDGTEAFNQNVLATRTYTIPGFQKEVQLVAIATDEQNKVLDVLNNITDIPSCVTYEYLKNGEKMFHIPEKNREILFTHRGSKGRICPSRVDKYFQRGYMFYE